PVRLVIMAMVGGITIWLVSRMNSERQAARQLQTEAEEVAEIGRTITSSLYPADIFPKFAHRLKRLIPYQRLGLIEIDYRAGTFWMVNSDGDELPSMPHGQTFPLPNTGGPERLLRMREARLLNDEACDDFLAHLGVGVNQYSAGTKSLIVAPIVTG